MNSVDSWRKRKLARLKKRAVRADGKDAEKLNEAVRKLQRKIRAGGKNSSTFSKGRDIIHSDGPDDEKGAWRTTKSGNHVFIKNGTVTKGNPKIVDALNNESAPPSALPASKEQTTKLRSSLNPPLQKRTLEDIWSNGVPKASKEPKMRVKGLASSFVKSLRATVQKHTKKNYDRATKVANDPRYRSLVTYTSHGPDHIGQVVEKTNQAADAIELLGKKHPAYSGPIDRKMMLVAAEFHDTGMDGCGKTYKDGDALRKDHALNSALHVLENSKAISDMGVNPSRAAALVLSHTKSNSGVGDLTKPSDWAKCLDTLDQAVKEYNDTHPRKKIAFNRSEVFGGEPDEENIKTLASSAAALRLGDANREANIPLGAQGGGKYSVEKMPKRGGKSSDAEEAGSEISIEIDGTRHAMNDEDEIISAVPGYKYSKKVVLGERNMAKADVRYDKTTNSLVEHITLQSGADVPWCTTIALLERCGELQTIKGVNRRLRVTMPGINSAKSLPQTTKNAYNKMLDDIRTAADKKTGEPKYNELDTVELEFEDGSVRVFKIGSEDRLDGKDVRDIW